jgi:ATP-binding cassette subfamily B protein
MRLPENIKVKIRQALHLDRALRLVWHSSPGWTVANFTLVLLQGFLPLVTLYLLKLIVDGVTAGLTSPDRSAAFVKVALWVSLAGLAALCGALCRSLAQIVNETQGQMIIDHVSEVIQAKSVEVDLEYYEDPKYYDTLHRAQQEAAHRPLQILNGLTMVGQSFITIIALTGLLVAFHWVVGVILFAATIPGVFMRLKYAEQLYHWQRQRTQSERKAHYLHFMLTTGGYAKEVRVFSLGGLFRKWFRELREKLREERLRITTRRSLAEFITQGSGTLAVFGTLAYISYQTLQGRITLGDMVMYFGAFQRAQGTLQDLLNSLTSLYEDNLFLSNFSEFLELSPRVAEPARPSPFPKPIHRGIQFHQVSFQYPPGNETVLQGVNITISPGTLVALVGENGSGKTTLIKLLCRLYDPSQGRITIDGIDLREFALADLRQHLSVIFQDYLHYNLSARQNIWLGDTFLSPQDDRIVTAARQSGAHPFINRLPRGYDTILGHWFEEEGELSTGQWQKVALARNFFKDAQMFILDEPTSWMDAQSEYEVFKNLKQLFGNRMALLISHRFSTVRLADFIYVLSGGKIVESGTHQELLRQGGTYAHLFELQSSSYC